MNDRSYLAILAGGALFAAGLAGCDAGDQRDPGSPEPDSTAMYGDEDAATQPDTMEQERMQAQERPGTTTTQDRPYTTSPEATTARERTAGAMAGLESMSEQELVGMTVVSREGEEIGDIDQVVTEGGAGAMPGEDKRAVIDVGGFLGIGEKSIAIPFDDLQLSQDGRLQTDLTREALESQPEYQRSDMGEGRTGEQTQ